MQQEITRELVQSWLPRRQADSNKGSYGSVLAAAGSLCLPRRSGPVCRGRIARRRGAGVPGQCGTGRADGAGPHAGMLCLRLSHGGGWGIHPRTPPHCAAGLPKNTPFCWPGRAWGGGRGSLPCPAGQESVVGGCGAGRRRTERACGGQAAGSLAGKYHPDAPPRRGRATTGLHRGRCTSRPGAGRFAAGRNLSLRRRSKGQRHVDCRAGRGALHNAV